MVKTVPAAFDTLNTWLTPTVAESTAAASHRLSIESCLKAHLGMTKLFRSGSFGHGTSLSGISDVDYMAVIPTANLKQNSNSTLQKVRDVLAIRFPRTAVTIRSPAVLVPFGTKNSERHEITPGDFLREANGSNVYDIPNRYGGWMATSPHAHGNWINDINKRVAGTKNLIRYIKLWNFMRGAGIRSFYLEMRVAQYAAGETYISRPYDILRALKFLRSKELAMMQDPTGLCGYFYPCSDAVKPEALSRLDTAITRAQRALDAYKADRHKEAIEAYHLLFNSYFPTYG